VSYRQAAGAIVAANIAKLPELLLGLESLVRRPGK
jgi:hypothetical protein